MQWKEGQVSLSILEKFSPGFFLAGQPAIPILDANPQPCQTLLEFYRGYNPSQEVIKKRNFK